MAITLADAQQNARDDIDFAVIDEFRKSSWLADNFVFDDAVTPGAGGATLTYGYTRVTVERAASFRDFGSDGADGTAERTHESVNLVPIAASYTVDRVLADLGPAATNEVAFQTSQAQKAIRAKFSESLIDGGSNTDLPSAFDGLDAALAGSSTEFVPDSAATGYADWSAISTEAEAHDALDLIDEFLALLDGTPTALLGNSKVIIRLRSLGRRAGYYERSRDDFGRMVETYNGVPFVDLGARSGSASPIIPVESRDPDGAGAGGTITGLTDLYAVRVGLDAVHGVATQGSQLLKTWLPDFSTAGAAKLGEVEMGPVAVALKASKGAGVLRNIKVQ